MTTQIDKFLSVGMKKYKQSSAVMVSFGKEIEKRLQRILGKRSSDMWGSFKPIELKNTKSTKYWSEYPLFNAKIKGLLGEIQTIITIDVNWYDSETEYPYYTVWIDPSDTHLQSLQEFHWQHDIVVHENGIRLYPNENDFDLDRDFNLILNEFVRFLEKQTR